MYKVFTEEVLIDIIGVLNKHVPKQGCNYYDVEDEALAAQLMRDIIEVKDRYMDKCYPERLEKK